MNEQLENLEPEQQDIAEHYASVASGMVLMDEGAVAELAAKHPAATKSTAQPPDLDALLPRLAESYHAELARIDRAIAQIEGQKDKILREAGDLPELESVLNVKQREYHDLMAARKPEEAAQKLDEGEQMKAEHKRLEDAWSDCERQIAELEGERPRAVRKVLDEWTPTVAPLIRADWRTPFSNTAKVDKVITEFIDSTGNTRRWGSNPWVMEGIDPNEYLRSLVATEEGEDQSEWYAMVEKLFIKERK